MSVDSCKKIYKDILTMLKAEKPKPIRAYLRSYINNPNATPSELRTIIAASQHHPLFKEDELLKELRAEVLRILESKIGKIY